MSPYEIDFLPEYTDEALLNELRRIAAFLPAGKPLTKTAYNQHGPKVAQNTVCRRFGGWKEALEKAGLEHLYVGRPVSQKMKEQAAKDMSKDDLIAELKRVHALVGKPYLTTDDFNRHSMTSEDAIRIRFGSFHKGLEVAGVPGSPYDHARRLTDSECFENLAAVWTQFGRAPKYREMFEPPSTIQGKTYVGRWGTWRRTVIAFVEWANSEGELGDTSEADQPTTGSKPVMEKPRTEADCREARPGLRFRVFMRDRFRYVACGRSPAMHLNIELHADHILAVANGGKTNLDNLQTLCQDCNLGKGRRFVS